MLWFLSSYDQIEYNVNYAWAMISQSNSTSGYFKFASNCFVWIVYGISDFIDEFGIDFFPPSSVGTVQGYLRWVIAFLNVYFAIKRYLWFNKLS